MEHRELLRSKNLLWLSCLLLLSCNSRIDQRQATFFILADTVNVVTKQGITYINSDKANGILFSLHNKKDTAFIKPYTKGKEDGMVKTWYDNGQQNEIRNYEKGWQQGEAKAWWPNGKQKFIYHFTNDVFEGNLKEWAINGMLARDMNYSKGQEEGPQKLWYDNGMLRSNYIIKNGRRYGLLGTKNCINVVDSIPAMR